MTYLEKWLNHNVWDGEDRSGCKNDRANFNPDDLLELFTDCHEDLELELNRAQSELTRVSALTIELTEELTVATNVIEDRSSNEMDDILASDCYWSIAETIGVQEGCSVVEAVAAQIVQLKEANEAIRLLSKDLQAESGMQLLELYATDSDYMLVQFAIDRALKES